MATLQKSSCNEFAAMGKGKYEGPVTGVFAVCCRHMMTLPGGVVDLDGAEK